MARFHFVEDYEQHVEQLLRDHPLDEAMSLAVGGGYEETGNLAAQILIDAGLRDGASVFDFGCGSGRVAHAVSKRVDVREYLGTDVVQALLDYAATRTPDHYVFLRHDELGIPAADATLDMVHAFSVFTHLLHTEIYIYMQDMARALKPGGTLVFSFLEFAAPTHWEVFRTSVAAQKQTALPHLNSFLERGQIEVLAAHAGFVVERYIDGLEPVVGEQSLGQSTAILRKA